QMLRQVAPDFKLLGMIPCRGVIVASRSADPQFDFVSRAFFPRLGVDEDPVCGSAHCCLGPFLQRRVGKNGFMAYQASARGGVVKVRVTKDRAFLGGRAITVAKGELLVEEEEPGTGSAMQPERRGSRSSAIPGPSLPVCSCSCPARRQAARTA